ncbi:MAG: ECF transporter S component [Propionibacteriaceae bacterium]|jgi:uncharacterized membrane protein|nr:ECF transporter S component [Propionibacteriaceae bacterium]
MMNATTKLSTAAAFLLAISAIGLDVAFLGDRGYYLVGMVIVVAAILPFVVSFEARRPHARELVVVAVLVTIGVVGRAAFFMVPQFKPVAAIVIIAAVTLGPQTGFLVGALTAFLSNFVMGQGPWTPWQMLAFGLIGFLAGLLFSHRFEHVGVYEDVRSRRRSEVRQLAALCVFGAVSVQVLYGLIVDTGSLLMFASYGVSWQGWLSLLASGAPFNAMHAASTVIFLLILAHPMIEKIQRVKVKYGLMQPDPVDVPLTDEDLILLQTTSADLDVTEADTHELVGLHA